MTETWLMIQRRKEWRKERRSKNRISHLKINKPAVWTLARLEKVLLRELLKVWGSLSILLSSSIVQSLYTFGKNWFHGGFLVVDCLLVVFHSFFRVFSWYSKYGYLKTTKRLAKNQFWKPWKNLKELWKDCQINHQLPENQPKTNFW